MDKENDAGFPHVGHIKFLFESYSPEAYFFEVIECGRRLSLASIIGIVSGDSAAAPVIGLLITVSSVEKDWEREGSGQIFLLLCCTVRCLLTGRRFEPIRPH